MLALSGGRLEAPMGGMGATEGRPILPAIGGRGLVVSKGGEAPSPPFPSTPSPSSNSETIFFGMGFPPSGPLPLSSGIEVSDLRGVSVRGNIAPGRGCWILELPGSLPSARPAWTARPAPFSGRRTERVSTSDGDSPDTASGGSPCE